MVNAKNMDNIRNIRAIEKAADSQQEIFDGGEKFLKADWEVHCALAEMRYPANAPEIIIDLCLQAADKYKLSNDELAFLVAWQLTAWRGNGISSSWAIKIVDAILHRVPKEDRMSSFCKQTADLLCYAHETSNEVNRRLEKLTKSSAQENPD